MNRLTNQEINNLISLLKSPDSKDWELALNVLANPSFKVKRQLCQAVKFAKIYFKHPYQTCWYTTYPNGALSNTYFKEPKLKMKIMALKQIGILSRKCLKYLELYERYDKRRNKIIYKYCLKKWN